MTTIVCLLFISSVFNRRKKRPRTGLDSILNQAALERSSREPQFTADGCIFYNWSKRGFAIITESCATRPNTPNKPNKLNHSQSLLVYHFTLSYCARLYIAAPASSFFLDLIYFTISGTQRASTSTDRGY